MGQKCQDKVPERVRNKVHKNFWRLGDYNAQNAYLRRLLKSKTVKRRRKWKKNNQNTFLSFVVALYKRVRARTKMFNVYYLIIIRKKFYLLYLSNAANFP